MPVGVFVAANAATNHEQDVALMGGGFMQKFHGFFELLDGIALYEDDQEWIFVNLMQLSNDPMHAVYYLFPQKEMWDMDEDLIYDDDFGNILPLKYKAKNLSPWLKIEKIKMAVVSMMRKNEHIINRIG